MALQCGIMVMPYSNNKRVTKEYKYTIYQYITFICHFLLLLHFSLPYPCFLLLLLLVCYSKTKIFSIFATVSNKN